METRNMGLKVLFSASDKCYFEKASSLFETSFSRAVTGVMFIEAVGSQVAYLFT